MLYDTIFKGGVFVKTEELLSVSLDIGEKMLISGAEISRVEDSLRLILTTYNIQRADVFTITSSIVATVTDDEGHTITQTRRIQKYNTDLEKLDALNALSRQICASAPPIEEIQDALIKTEKKQHYGLGIQCLAYALIAGAFAVFFGGTWSDGIAAACLGALLKLLTYATDRTKINMVFANAVASFAMCVSAFLCAAVFQSLQADKIIIGNTMLLIPGIAMTNSIRDIISGDSMAGILRFCEALVIAIAIAAGYILASLLMGGLSK